MRLGVSFSYLFLSCLIAVAATACIAEDDRIADAGDSGGHEHEMDSSVPDDKKPVLEGDAAVGDAGWNRPEKDAGRDGGSTADHSCACLEEKSVCADDEGCTAIIDCADETGCTGTGCYFAEPKCMHVIDTYGATSLSTTLAVQLMDCRDAQATCGFDDGGVDDGGVDDADSGF